MKKSKLWIKIDKLLWEEWDPIGVNACGGLDDEYSSYVPSIIKLVEERADEFKIAKLLYQHANVNMGLQSALERHIEIAKKLRNLIK